MRNCLARPVNHEYKSCRRFSLPTIFFFTIFFTSASPAMALTIDDAVQLALENSHRIKEEQYKFESQEHLVKSEKAGFLPDLDLDYSFTRQNNVLSFQRKESSAASLKATYNLFNGYIDSNSLKEAESMLDAYSYQKRAVEADIVFEVKTAFLELLRARKSLEVSREGAALLQGQKREAALYYREGLVAKNDLLKVEVELASALQELLRDESSVRIAKDRLERLMGPAIGEGDEIVEIVQEDYTEIDYDILADVMFSRRSEIKYLKALKSAKEFGKEKIIGNYLPEVDLSLTYSRFGDSVSPTGRSGLHDDETRTMVTAEWEIAEGVKRREDVRADEAKIRATEEQIKDLLDELKLQLKRAIEGYRLAKSSMAVAKKATAQAEENYRITESQFRQQMATATNLLDARLFLSRARNEHNNVIYDLQQSVAEIERVTESELKQGKQIDRKQEPFPKD